MRLPLTMALALVVTGVGPLAGQTPTERRTYSVPHVLEAVGRAIEQPMPAGLSAAEQQAYTQHTEWLKTVQARLQKLVPPNSEAAPREAATGMASGRRQHKPLTLEKDVGDLQKAVEAESRRFTTLSNVMKTRHDTVMNAIRNMKA